MSEFQQAQSPWREGILSDIAYIVMGQSPSGETCNTITKGIPLLNGPTEFGIKNPKAVQYTTDAKKTSLKDDVLFCVRGSTTGRMNWADQEYAIGRGLATMRHKNGNEYRFFLKGIIDYNLSLLLQSATGSTFPNISKSELERLEIQIPPLPEQKAIAEVLSSLDDKIDLLHRQNKTLEQMAETLFREWFVEEAGDEWEYDELDNYVTCYNGVSYKSVDLNPSETAMVTLKSFSREGGFRLDGFKEYTGKYKEQHIVKLGDLAVAHTDITQDAAVVGNPVLIIGRKEYKTLVISMDLVKVEPKYSWLSKEFLYYLMRTRLFKEHCLGHANGSTVLHLNKKAIPSFEFFLPPLKKIKLFTEHAKNLLSKKNTNINQITTLEKLRDTLLPKLMSGEIKLRS